MKKVKAFSWSGSEKNRKAHTGISIYSQVQNRVPHGQLIFQKILTQNLFIPVTPIIYFWIKLQTGIAFLISVSKFLYCSLKSRYHSIAAESKYFCRIFLLFMKKLCVSLSSFFFVVGILNIGYTNWTSYHDVVT